MAAFDFDREKAYNYQFSRAVRYFIPACLFFQLGSVSNNDTIATLHLVVSFLFLIVALIYWKKARVIARSEIHMAVTTRFVQYDQESPQAHVMVRTTQRFVTMC